MLDAPASTEPLALPQAVRQALGRHPTIADALATLSQQESGVEVARAGYYPQMRVGLTGGRNNGVATSNANLREGTLATASVSQMLYDFGKVAGTVNQSEALVHRQQASVLKQIDTISQQTAEAVVAVHRYQALLKISGDQVVAVEKILETARLRANASLSPQADPIQAESRVDNARANYLDVKSQYAQARERLRTLLGGPVPQTLAPLPEQIGTDLNMNTMPDLTDLPFFFLFLFVMWLVGGPLALVALCAVPLLVIPGILIQRPLARMAGVGMRESALRNALLVEAVEGIEDIKLLRAEPRFQNQWNHVNDVAASVSMRQRFLTGLLLTWTQEVQNIVYASVLLTGCYLVMKGDMTTGALVGSSILASRMIAPLAQLSGVFSRWQQAKIARNGLNQLMQRPVDQPPQARLVHAPALRGEYTVEAMRFRYGEQDKHAALEIQRLQIKAGEKVALLGRMGAGKSTLLQLLAGLQTPQQGSISLDGLDLSLIDPSDVRRDMGMLTQNARLFHGTIRENLVMGMPLASDAEVMAAVKMAGAQAFVQSRAKGLEDMIHEGGLGLSGGQRQALLLARLLVRQPSIVLLDEPTAHFDEVTERQVIEAMDPWLASRTLVVTTHRMPILQWVDRIVVIDGGRIVMDGSKDQILGKLSNGNA